MSELGLIVPDWPASPKVRAVLTLRSGGVSAGPFRSLNMGAHVGDEPAAVAENRRRLRGELRLPAEPAWLSQVHGTQVIDLDSATAVGLPPADATVARSTQHVCVVQVADCMPVLFTTRQATAVAAAHAGWRGLAAGVLESTVRSLSAEPAEVIAWLGTAIGPEHFEVGEEVRAQFLAHDANAARAFHANARGRWQCDLYMLARQRLTACGVTAIFGGTGCTYADPARFFSFRRDGQCGRMAALIWLAP
jgi:polyphenol oxidase